VHLEVVGIAAFRSSLIVEERLKSLLENNPLPFRVFFCNSEHDVALDGFVGLLRELVIYFVGLKSFIVELGVFGNIIDTRTVHAHILVGRDRRLLEIC
jgi:hypothetical protein